MQRDLLGARDATAVGSNSQANDGSICVATDPWICAFGWQVEMSGRSSPTGIAAQTLHRLCLVRFQDSKRTFLAVHPPALRRLRCEIVGCP